MSAGIRVCGQEMQNNDAVTPMSPAKIVRNSSSIADFLTTNEIRPTRQRVAIATHMFETEQHLSADAILERVNSDTNTTTVSKATVYNTLKLFVKKGVLKEVALDPQRIMFDTNIHDHHHVLNLDSGDIRDINPVSINLSNIEGIQNNHDISGVDIVIKVRNVDK